MPSWGLIAACAPHKRSGGLDQPRTRLFSPRGLLTQPGHKVHLGVSKLAQANDPTCSSVSSLQTQIGSIAADPAQSCSPELQPGTQDTARAHTIGPPPLLQTVVTPMWGEGGGGGLTGDELTMPVQGNIGSCCMVISIVAPYCPMHTMLACNPATFTTLTNHTYACTHTNAGAAAVHAPPLLYVHRCC